MLPIPCRKLKVTTMEIVHIFPQPKAPSKKWGSIIIDYISNK
jgi:hypothetical protein